MNCNLTELDRLTGEKCKSSECQSCKEYECLDKDNLRAVLKMAKNQPTSEGEIILAYGRRDGKDDFRIETAKQLCREIDLPLWATFSMLVQLELSGDLAIGTDYDDSEEE